MSKVENLRPFSKGDPRIYKGGKGKHAISTKEILKRILGIKQDIQDPAAAMVDPTTKKRRKVTQAEIILLKQMELARKGNLRSAEFLFDRLEGKPVQSTQLSNPDGGPIIPQEAFEQMSDEKLQEMLLKNMEALKKSEEI